jgi:acetyl-CoA C-acetyltransferase
VGGFENMSMVPFYVPKGRSGYGYGHGEFLDGVVKDGLWDSFDNHHMGICAEKCASDYNISREDQDAHAIQSCKRALDANQKGLFKHEIAPVEIKDKKGNVTVVSEDEGLKKIRLDKIPTLKPAFKKDGTVTAANASSLNDGAAALVLVDESTLKALDLNPLARILGFDDAGKAPIEFTTAPALAIERLVKKHNKSLEDVDYFEINEAFSVVARANEKVNWLTLFV